jgi:ketosteroid isomerase-like protein
VLREIATAIIVCVSAEVLIARGPDQSTPRQAPTATVATSTQEIDKDVWSVIIQTVAADDIVRMGDVYFPDAIVVGPRGTKPIKETLERWGRDMVAAKAKGNRATVEFRFAQRQDDQTTAYESGIFKYTVIDKAGKSSSTFTPFQQLLAKTNGRWRVLMERQLSEVTQVAWDGLPK